MSVTMSQFTSIDVDERRNMINERINTVQNIIAIQRNHINSAIKAIGELRTDAIVSQRNYRIYGDTDDILKELNNERIKVLSHELIINSRQEALNALKLRMFINEVDENKKLDSILLCLETDFGDIKLSH